MFNRGRIRLWFNLQFNCMFLLLISGENTTCILNTVVYYHTFTIFCFAATVIGCIDALNTVLNLSLYCILYI